MLDVKGSPQGRSRLGMRQGSQVCVMRLELFLRMKFRSSLMEFCGFLKLRIEERTMQVYRPNPISVLLSFVFISHQCVYLIYFLQSKGLSPKITRYLLRKYCKHFSAARVQGKSMEEDLQCCPLTSDLLSQRQFQALTFIPLDVR